VVNRELSRRLNLRELFEFAAPRGRVFGTRKLNIQGSTGIDGFPRGRLLQPQLRDLAGEGLRSRVHPSPNVLQRARPRRRGVEQTWARSRQWVSRSGPESHSDGRAHATSRRPRGSKYKSTKGMRSVVCSGLPSLATTKSAVYGPSRTPFHSDSFQKIWPAGMRPTDEARNWTQSVVRPHLSSFTSKFRQLLPACRPPTQSRGLRRAS
jgi:hypothetical protein